MTTTPFKQNLLRGIVGVLAIQVSFLPVSFALRVQLKTNVKLREHVDKSMERVGLLKRGSIVEIPDSYTVRGTDGKPNLELTLNNWLRVAGELRANGDGTGRYAYDGEKSEMFFPIRITDPAEGSTIRTGHQDHTQFIALRFLARRGAAMIVSEDAKVEDLADDAPPAAHPSPPVDTQGAMEASSQCADGLCSRPSDASGPVRRLVEAVTPALVNSNGRSKQLFDRTDNDLRFVYGNFRHSCGFDLNQLIPIVKSRAHQSEVPAEILLALMTQESSGKCYALNSETDKTQSVGLFQINSAARLATGPRCLENPVINIEEAIRLLTAAKNTLTNGRTSFDASRISSENLWRMAVSSYNGGPRWVLQAKNDLHEFNAKNGTSLDENNWEDLRLFFMRGWLNRDQQQSHFGTPPPARGLRSRENSAANLAYAENIMGRPATSNSRPALTSAWLATVKDE